MVFAPVDVRNFVQTGLMIHSYPVHTGQDKLRRYLADASPLSLALHLATQREAVGRARVGLAGPADNIEVGCFILNCIDKASCLAQFIIYKFHFPGILPCPGQ